MRPTEYNSLREGVAPGNGSLPRLVTVERELIPMLIKLWDATIELRRNYGEDGALKEDLDLVDTALDALEALKP